MMMLRLFTLAALLTATACALPASAQGGQGGFGGGGFGGGAGGRLGRAAEDEAQVFNHILTPGDRGEWPITAKEGETIIVRASSTAFDPALQVVDAAGKVLAENDDIRPGVQDALILYRFPRAGAYKVLVKGYKSAGGGQYQLSLLRFMPADLQLSVRTAGAAGRTHVKYLRFNAQAGQTLVVNARTAAFAPNLRLYAPNGERIEVSTARNANGRGERVVFRAAATGSYHVRIGPSDDPRDSYAVTAAVARVQPIAIGDPPKQAHLGQGGLDIWTFKAAPGDLVEVSARSASGAMSVEIEAVPPAERQGEPQPGEGYASMPSDPKTHAEVALIRSAGTFQASISHPLQQEAAYTVSVSRIAHPWPQTGSAGATLPIGGSDYWTLEGRKGQIVRLEAKATQFDAELELYSLQGDRLDHNDDGAGGRDALLTTLLPEAGRYLVRVHSHGDGGSGAYLLSSVPSGVQPLTAGQRGAGTLGAGGTGIWSFQGKAGQTVVISVRSAAFDTMLSLFGPDALEVASNDDGPEGTDSLLSVRLPLDGVYTLWVTGKGGGGQYTIRWLDLE